MDVHGKKSQFDNLDDPIAGIWNQRGENNTEDLPDQNQKKLEIEKILEFIKPGMKVLDVGCGNGKVGVEISKIAESVCGIDFAESILNKAKSLESHNLTFQFGDVKNLEFADESFDLVLSERCLINLNNTDEIEQALNSIRRVLKKGGIYLMLETSAQGVESLSNMRKQFGLDEIKIPWHNLPIDENWLAETSKGIFEAEENVYFGTYFFISRIIHPLLVQPEMPKFDGKLNEVARTIAKQYPNINNEMSQVILRVLKAI